jgi:short-subunit dehydrogenase involved in D-alanine esterification of teichoic acids
VQKLDIERFNLQKPNDVAKNNSIRLKFQTGMQLLKTLMMMMMMMTTTTIIWASTGLGKVLEKI